MKTNYHLLFIGFRLLKPIGDFRETCIVLEVPERNHVAAPAGMAHRLEIAGIEVVSLENLLMLMGQTKNPLPASIRYGTKRSKQVPSVEIVDPQFSQRCNATQDCQTVDALKNLLIGFAKPEYDVRGDHAFTENMASILDQAQGFVIIPIGADLAEYLSVP